MPDKGLLDGVIVKERACENTDLSRYCAVTYLTSEAPSYCTHAGPVEAGSDQGLSLEQCQSVTLSSSLSIAVTSRETETFALATSGD